MPIAPPGTVDFKLPIPADDGGRPTSFAPSSPISAVDLVAKARQSYVDALPIATGIFADDAQGLRLLCANPLFTSLYEGGPVDSGHHNPLRNHDAFSNTIAEFMASDQAELEMEWIEGGFIGCRYFTLRMAKTAHIGLSKRCVVSLLDRTAAMEAERSLRTELIRDSLTGLPNRTAFTESLDAALKAAEKGIAVLIIDLKRFSLVNESLGSIAGDELIITVASRLVGALRNGDLLARLGGDEFSILLHLNGPDDALLAAQRIFDTLSTPFRLSDMEIRIDVAVGYAVMDEGVDGSASLIRNAQIAMKRAKASGKVELYQQGEASAVRQRFSIETELRRAIDADRLTLSYQPIFDVQQGRLAGFEALARWEHPELGEISPVDFIPVAEECGLIVPLGRWATTVATQTLAEWDRRNGAPLPISMSVNVSAVQLARDNIPELASKALSDAGLQGDRLTLEITESAIIRDPDAVKKLLSALKETKATIAMDDFGTGYSSLAALQKLPIDVLKIDRSFVTGMLQDRDSVAIIRAILSLANALGMNTTAEGIETPELVHMLAAMGCTYGQGFHYATALPADGAYDFLQSLKA